IAETPQPVTSVGYTIIVQDDDLTRRYRFEMADYTRARKSRGRSNNWKCAVLTHMLSEEKADLETFLQYYPLCEPHVKTLEQQIDKLAEKLFRDYVLKFIDKNKKNYQVSPSSHYEFLWEFHQRVYVDSLRTIKKAVALEHMKKFLQTKSAEDHMKLLAPQSKRRPKKVKAE